MNEQEIIKAKIAQIAQRCRWDLFYLAKYILDYELMEEKVHADLCKYTEALLPSLPPDYLRPKVQTGTGMEDQFHPKNTNLLLLMPRGTFKSSVVTIGFTLQYILNDPNARILIDSETFSKAKAFLSEIKGHLQGNEQYREVFKSIHGVYPDEGKKKDMLWSDSQLNISARTNQRKEPTFSCAGVDVTKNGMHYDLIIMDDLHSEKNVTTKDQIDQVIDHWKLAYSLLDPGKPLICIGTRWDYNDLYQHILDFERESYNILVRSAHYPDKDTLLFPERLTEAFLDDVKRKQGSYIYSAQYENNPVDDETATFKRKDMIRKEWDLVKDRPMNWYLAVDPSYEGQYSDFSALVLAGMDSQRDIYVRHVIRQKMTYSQIIDNMFELYTKYNPRLVVIETIAAQKSIMYELNNEQKRRATWMRLKEIKKRTMTKDERIRGLAPFYEYGHIYHIKDCPQLDELEYELVHFPRGKHDDVIDALATVLEVATPAAASSKVVDEDERKKKRLAFKPRSPVTGY